MEAIDRDKLKENLSDELCEFCPWRNGEIPHACVNVCDGNFVMTLWIVFSKRTNNSLMKMKNDTRQSLFRNRRV